MLALPVLMILVWCLTSHHFSTVRYFVHQVYTILPRTKKVAVKTATFLHTNYQQGSLFLLFFIQNIFDLFYDIVETEI